MLELSVEQSYAVSETKSWLTGVLARMPTFSEEYPQFRVIGGVAGSGKTVLLTHLCSVLVDIMLS